MSVSGCRMTCVIGGVQESAGVLHNSVGRSQAWSTRVHINPVREVQRDV